MPTLKINGKEYTVPALSLKQLRNGGLELIKQTDEATKVGLEAELGQGTMYDSMELRGKLIYMALQRTNPELAEDDVMDALDLSNAIPIWLSVLGQSGFTPQGELKAEGPQTGEGVPALTPGT